MTKQTLRSITFSSVAAASFLSILSCSQHEEAAGQNNLTTKSSDGNATMDIPIDDQQQVMKTESESRLHVRWIDVDWMKENCKLLVELVPPLVDPMQTRERLFLVTNESKKEIDSLGDLSGSVSFSTASQALEYVRLLTSPRTFYMWSGGAMLEVMTRENLALSTFYGERTMLDYYTSSPDWYMAIADQAVIEKIGLHDATVTTSEAGFVITRYVLKNTIDDEPAVLVKLTELVEHDGDYSVLASETLVRPKGFPKNWSIPKFE